MESLTTLAPDIKLYIGLMSGTSADGIDAVLTAIGPSDVRLLAHHHLSFNTPLRHEIHALCQPGPNEIERAGAMDTRLGELFAQAVNQLLSHCGVPPSRICAIGSHGQTIRHRPRGTNPHPFSWQIGDANIIAARTGIATVADFRRRDIAHGGQGAPLVPAFHADAFAHPHTNRAIVNIGGIANISWLPAGGAVLGFDTGPGNTLMDGWITQQRGLAYDANGKWAASAAPHKALLALLLEHPYLQRPAPKSTGREEFHVAWLERQLQRFGAIEPEAVQATLAQFTVETVARHLEQCPQAHLGGELYLCGGGAHNHHLQTSLSRRLTHFKVMHTGALGIDPDWVEAAAFAWLAHRRLAQQPGNLPSATGAKQEAILGAVYTA